MSTISYWLWHLFPGNPIMLRVLYGGSSRLRHFWVRIGYLGALIGLVLIGLMSGGGLGGSASMTELAISGATVFMWVAYGQVALICLLAPLFMAGAINEEQSGETFDILLTTPLSNLQIVMGSLLGRLFFVLTLLASGLPLFAVLQIFGGVPISAVFTAFAVAALAAITVGSVAITLAVLRKGGRKAVYVFMIVIAGYLITSYAADRMIRLMRNVGGTTMVQSPGDSANINVVQTNQGQTTWITPLHPLLVLEASINTTSYRPPDPDDLRDRNALVRFYLSNPLGAFAAMTMLISTSLILWSALRVRAVGSGEGKFAYWLRKKLKLPAVGAERRRPPRQVWNNPIAWREANARGRGIGPILARWFFAAIAVGIGVALLLAYHFGALPDIRPEQNALPDEAWVFTAGLLTLLLIELAVIVMVAIYMSAGAVSKEREDGTLDLMLTTPITPRYFIWGKLRGLVSFLGTLLAVPILTLAIIAGYTLVGQWVGSSKAYRPGPFVVNQIDVEQGTLKIGSRDSEWRFRQGDQIVLSQSGANNGVYSVATARSSGSNSWTLTINGKLKDAAMAGRVGHINESQPLLLPEAPILLLLLLVPFVAMCTTVGVNWSVKSKGVLGAVLPSIMILGVLAIIMGFCGLNAVRHISVVGPFVNAFSPTTSLVTIINPDEMRDFLRQPGASRIALFVSSGFAAGGYALIVYLLITGMVRGFDQTVRKLSGTA